MKSFVETQMKQQLLKPTRPGRPIHRFAVWAFVGGLGLFAGLAGAASSFAQIVGSAQLNVERRGHTATLLQDGRVLIVGGDNQSGMVSQAETLDPVAQTASLAAASITARTDHTATRLADGRVLVIGGRDQGSSLASTEIYNPLTSTFTAGPSLLTARSGHTATVLSDGKIFIAGGDAGASAEIYDPATDSFSPVSGGMNTGRKFHSAIRMNSRQVLIVGGIDAQNTVLNTAEVFDPASQSFYLPPTDMQAPRALATMKLLPDGKVQIIGGDAELSMEVFDPNDGIFIAKALLPPNADLLGATLSTQSRAALFSPLVLQDPLLQATMTPEQSALLDRADQSITELPARNQALVAGGINSAGQILNSAKLVQSASASITTDKTDYAPGQIVTITGSGFQPNERVDISFHEFPEEYPDIFFSVNANQQGNFVTAEFAPQEIDLGRIFTLTAIGQASGFVAQTAFKDNKNFTITFAGTGGGSITFSSVTGSPNPVTNPCTATCNNAVNNNATGTLTVTPNPGSVFVGWTGTWDTSKGGSTTCTGSTSPCNFDMGSSGGGADQSLTATFNTAAATPTKLAFGVQPTNANKDATITPAVTVRILDASNNLVTTSTRSVTLAIGTNPSGGTLSGTITVAAVGGIATFNALSINNAGNGYNLVASSALPAPALTTVTSSAFNIAKLDQTITLNNVPATAAYNSTFTPTATSTSGLAVAITVDGVCTINGSNLVTMTSGTGNCTVKANQAGDANYNAAPQKTTIAVAEKVDPTCTVSGYTGIYDHNAHGATGNCTGVGGAGDVLAGLNLGSSFTNVPGGTANWTFTDATGNYNNKTGGVAITITTAFDYDGFYSPIGGSVEYGTGGSYAYPVKSFKLGSTIPVKFGATWLNGGGPLITGIHTLQAIKYSNATVSEPAIDATPTDSATTGNQFRLTGTDWHFNLSTKNNGFSAGTWKLIATLVDGSQHSVWIAIKK